MRKSTVYIAHPISGDVEGNKRKVRAICHALALRGEVIPCAPYLEACEYLDDTIPAERELGIAMNEELIIRGAFEKMWLYGDKISSGMEREIKLAWDLGIPVVSKTTMTAKALSDMEAHEKPDYGPHETIVRYLKRTGPIPLDDLRRWLWKHSPKDAVVINSMIGKRMLRFHGEGLIGLSIHT